MGCVKLTQRQMELYEALRDQRTTADIARGVGMPGGPMTKQQQSQIITKILIPAGVIRRPEGLSKYDKRVGSKDYPWQPTELMPTVGVPTARLRYVYAAEDARDMAVTPISLIRWTSSRGIEWSVQGVPIRHPSGLNTRQAPPEERIVYANNMTRRVKRVFLAPLRHRWTEALTDEHLGRKLTPEERRELTLMIAAVIGETGVDTVPDIDAPGAP